MEYISGAPLMNELSDSIREPSVDGQLNARVTSGSCHDSSETQVEALDAIASSEMVII